PDALPRVRRVGRAPGRAQDGRAQRALPPGNRTARCDARRCATRRHAGAGRLGEELGVLLDRTHGVAGRAREARGCAREHGMVKALSFFKRRAGMSVDEFQAYWLGRHPDVVTKLPGVRRCVQSHTRPAVYRDREPVYDGIAEVWFDDTAAMHTLRG